MPIYKSRGNYVKVFRPNGARHAHGQTLPTAEAAVISSEDAFFKEFREIPRPVNRFYEVLGVTSGYAATLWEIHEVGSIAGK